jgi:hypothetical protein
MEQDSLLVSYLDADIYQRDLLLFQPGAWLNDSCINFCLKRRIKSDSGILTLDPAVVSFLRLQADEEDDDELTISLGINNAVWLFAPVNDNDSFNASSNHWSLLLYHIRSGNSFHFDSSSGYNREASIKVAARIAIFTKSCRAGIFTAQQTVFQVSGCPQQHNGYDCGVFCLLFAEHIVAYLSPSLCPPSILKDGQEKGQVDEVATAVIDSGGTVLSHMLSKTLAPVGGMRLPGKELKGQGQGQDVCWVYRQSAIEDVQALSARYLNKRN